MPPLSCKATSWECGPCNARAAIFSREAGCGDFYMDPSNPEGFHKFRLTNNTLILSYQEVTKHSRAVSG